MEEFPEDPFLRRLCMMHQTSRRTRRSRRIPDRITAKANFRVDRQKSKVSLVLAEADAVIDRTCEVRMNRFGSVFSCTIFYLGFPMYAIGMRQSGWVRLSRGNSVGKVCFKDFSLPSLARLLNDRPGLRWKPDADRIRRKENLTSVGDNSSFDSLENGDCATSCRRQHFRPDFISARAF